MSTKDHLPREQIQQIMDAAINAGLAKSRSALMGGIDPRFVLSLPDAANAQAQLLLDLSELNRVLMLADRTVPLFVWLSNAAKLADHLPEGDVFRVALEALKIKAATAPGPQARADAPVSIETSALLALSVSKFWPDPRGGALHKVLKVAYDKAAKIQQIAALAGVDVADISMSGSANDIWFDLLSSAIRAAKIKQLLSVILKDENIAFYHPQIRKLLS